MAEGDECATRAFVSTYGPRLRNHLRRRHALNATQADDLAESIVSDVVLKITMYQPELGSFDGWFWVTARNACVDWLRSQRRFNREYAAGDDLPEVGPAGNVPAIDDQIAACDAIVAAIRSLPTRDGRIIHLRYFEHQPLNKIAATLEMKPGACRVAHHRALGVLREKLEQSGFQSGGT